MSQEYQANLIKMQHQIRNNAQEYSDFVSDLQKWTKNISEKDKKLQEAPQTKKYPPVRGTTEDVEERVDPEEEAEKLKDAGNEFFKKGDMEKAIENYTKSLQFKQDHIVYSNRSQAYFKLKKFKESEIDATKSISLNSSYVKSYMRRGMARRELKMYKESKEDFEYARKLNPTHSETKRELDLAIELLKKSEEGKAKKVTIEEEDDEEDAKKPIAPVVETKPVVTTPIPQVKPKEEVKKVEEEIEDLVTSGASHNLKDIQKKKQETGQVTQTKQETNKTETKPSNTKQATSIPETITINVKPTVPQIAPKSFYEFEKYFNELKGENFANYLKVIPPKRFSTILQDSLSPEVFTGIIKAISTYFLRKPLDTDMLIMSFEILQEISRVNRFGMTVMFLEDTELLILRSIFDVLFDNLDLNKYDVEKLKSLYLEQ